MARSKKPINQKKTEAFTEKAVVDISAAYTTLMCVLGDRLGLFKDLAENGPATSQDLAQRARISERYAREWLSGLSCAGYLEYHPKTHRFKLPPEHIPALVQEGGPLFVAGIYQSFSAELKNLDNLVDVFRKGGGVPQESYDENESAGMERMSAAWFENLLVQQWIPAVPDVKKKLEQGAVVADIGCGRGRALIKLAQAFPKSRYVGYDVYAPSIENAKANAAAARVEDKVSFRPSDVAKGLPEKYDLITTFDVIHDSVDPLRVLKSIREALKPAGTYLLLEFNCKDRLEQNIGPIGALVYGFSIMYCMTVSLANGGTGLGTAGLPESKVREICAEAGFRRVRRLPLKNPFNILYEVKP